MKDFGRTASVLIRYIRKKNKPGFLSYWTSPFLGKLLLINILPLLFLAGLLLYLNQYQNGLLYADVMALRDQAHIYTHILEINAENDPAQQKFLDGARAGKLLDELMQSSLDGHIRLFDPNGELLVDSRRHHTVIDKTLPMDDEEFSHSREGVWHPPRRNIIDRFYNWVLLDSLAPYKKGMIPFKVNPNSNDFDDDDKELNIKPFRAEVPPYIRRNAADALLITIIEPVISKGRTIAELQLTRRAPEIDRILFAVRSSILTLMLVAIGVTIMLSWYLSYTIARPILQLVDITKTLSLSGGRHLDALPQTLMNRKDEIGSLARSMRSSAIALWARIDGTERFASEVAHEVKNPLASLGSALEILPRIEKQEARLRLVKVLQDDVKRLQRLVRDIADASRIEGELSRGVREPVTIEPLLSLLVELHQATRKEHDPIMVLDIPESNFYVCAVEDRLVQVFRNLIGNALSFSPPDGAVTIRVRRAKVPPGANRSHRVCQCGYVDVMIEDEGPGLPPDKLATIFERFYSERPKTEEFGQHSGLGLAISREIVHALGGEIYAENRMGIRKDTGMEGVLGARFVVCLPACGSLGKNPNHCTV